MSKKLTTEEFVIRAIEIHGNEYDYSKVVYRNASIGVIIICPIHGEFLQTPNHHLKGCGCSRCSGVKKSTTKEFIIKSNKIHNNQYNYSKVIYINAITKVKIICPIDGVFLQTPNNHLGGQGCPKCGFKKNSLSRFHTTEIFIKRARRVHKNKYNYNKSVYKNAITKLIVTCPIDGDFLQTPNNHINQKKGCPQCRKRFLSLKFRDTKKQFVKNAKKIHKNTYKYNRVHYVKNNIKVAIGCQEHGYFMQIPASHLSGAGCPCCRRSNGEKSIKKILDNYKIKYIAQKTFPDCINKKTKCRLKYDFCLPQQNALIEYNGEQHYKYISYWHRNGQTLKGQQYRDILKKEYALSHGYRFLVIKYNDKNIEEILSKNLIFKPIIKTVET